MNRKITLGLLILLTVSGCQVKEIIIDNKQEAHPKAKVFRAIIDDSTSPETRTSLDGSGNVLWKMGDKVSIFVGSTVNEQYQVSDDSDGKTVASLNKVGESGFVVGTEIDNNVAFYPYASTAVIAKNGSSYVISKVELPATQTYVTSSFGNGAFPMTAVTISTGDKNFKFKNILGGLKLQLKGTATIASIAVTGKNNEKLYGDAEVTMTNGSTPSINLTDVSAKTVTLDCGAGVALNKATATPFIIALPPITMAGGFTVRVTDTDGKHMTITTTKSQTITRSNLLKMPVVDYVGVPPENTVDLGLSVRWAKGNLSDSGIMVRETQYGDYYAWGETATKSGYSSFSWSGYHWCEGAYSTLTKYNTNDSYGTVDDKTVLDDADDAAHVILGGNWRIPTSEDWEELISNCTKEYYYNGSYGWKFTSNINGNSIFLPLPGVKSEWGHNAAGSSGNYWSSSLDTDNPNFAVILYIIYGKCTKEHNTRCNGGSIRPIFIE